MRKVGVLARWRDRLPVTPRTPALSAATSIDGNFASALPSATAASIFNMNARVLPQKIGLGP